ncbi:four helix bundle protein [Ferruginibacter paludis]|uniref:four helix bundle protein n=1 Tax=Ferruginibacter paludis TaxID=1310417 RepID=UPI0025B4161E|nr:four helix bundle protein [Ferruginibacter paludis]MDN3657979.1 four helix bundle protein [Ferruginibacter paludis]
MVSRQIGTGSKLSFLNKMRDYKKYDVWVKSHELVLFIYKEVLASFPINEKYDLLSQLKRATYSIPLNIVEGCGRSTDKDFVHFLDISLGSAQETEYCLLLAFDLQYINNEIYQLSNSKVNSVKAMLINLIKSIRK